MRLCIVLRLSHDFTHFPLLLNKILQLLAGCHKFCQNDKWLGTVEGFCEKKFSALEVVQINYILWYIICIPFFPKNSPIVRCDDDLYFHGSVVSRGVTNFFLFFVKGNVKCNSCVTNFKCTHLWHFMFLLYCVLLKTHNFSFSFLSFGRCLYSLLGCNVL